MPANPPTSTFSSAHLRWHAEPELHRPIVARILWPWLEYLNSTGTAAQKGP